MNPDLNQVNPVVPSETLHTHYDFSRIDSLIKEKQVNLLKKNNNIKKSHVIEKKMISPSLSTNIINIKDE